MKVRHVIFDCDGVLVDSEWLSSQVEARLLGEAGIAMEAGEIARRFVGRSVPEMFRTIEEESGIALPPGFHPHYKRELARAFATHLQPVDGVDDVLASLTSDRSVASNSALGRVRNSLAVTGLDRHFRTDRVFSADMVTRPKPSPDLHRHIISITGSQAQSSIVIEDSASGVEAASAAGIRVIGFTGASHCQPDLAGKLEAAGAERVFGHMEEVAGFLKACA